jgi:hypothetical protein
MSQLMSTVPGALQGLASPATSTATSSGSGLSGLVNLLTGNSTSTTGFSGLFNELFSSSGLGLNDNLWNTMFSSGFYMPGNFLGTMSDFVGLGNSGGADAAAAAAGDAALGATAANGVGGALSAPAAGLSELGSTGGAVSAAMGRGTAIGALTMPPSMNAMVPTESPFPGLSGEMPPAPPPAVAPGVPGMPFVSAAGNHISGDSPRYGFRPTVMVQSPAAG